MNVHMLELTQYGCFRSESEVSDTTAPRSQFSAAEYARQQGQHKAIIAKVLNPTIAHPNTRCLRAHHSHLSDHACSWRALLRPASDASRARQQTSRGYG